MALEIADPQVPPGERNWQPRSLDRNLANDLATLTNYRCRLVSCAFWHHLPPWQPPQRELIDEGIYLSLAGGMAITTKDGKRHAVSTNRIALVPRWRRHQHGYLFDGQQSHELLSIHCHWTNPARTKFI